MLIDCGTNLEVNCNMKIIRAKKIANEVTMKILSKQCGSLVLQWESFLDGSAVPSKALN